MNRSQRYGAYDALWDLEWRWAELAASKQGRTVRVGKSVKKRAILRFDFGNQNKPVVLLTALIHGIELIGGLGLFRCMKALIETRADLLDHFQVVVMPILNPDAWRSNLKRLERNQRAAQRCNARGVDLNRNFPLIKDISFLHPFAGSRRKWSPHYMGPEAFSEPETQSVKRVAEETRPLVSMGFHSFGNLLLYPWAFTKEAHPRTPLYQRLGRAFTTAQPERAYLLGPSRRLYPTVGDMDDWLDTEYGTLAYTVEVGSPGWRVFDPRRMLEPFHWMNAEDLEGTLSNLIPGFLAFFDKVKESLIEESSDLHQVSTLLRNPLLAAK